MMTLPPSLRVPHRTLRLGAGLLLALFVATSDAGAAGDSGGDGSVPGTQGLTTRNAHALVYDGARQQVLLFGGADHARVYGDLWAWDGESWQSVSRSGPPPRTFPALTYDGARKQVLLFGGNRVLFGTPQDRNTFLNDLWAWNGSAWRQIETPTAPPPRAEAAMTYDEARQRVVLFGGYRMAEGKFAPFGDTWEWDGSEWRQVATEGPSPRNGAAMTYDAGRRRVVLFGGKGASDETWEWDGSDWRRITSAQTVGRFNTALAYGEITKTVLRFGGWDGKGRVADTWQYDGTNWQHLDIAGPSARNHSALVFDRRRQRFVLFGGHDGPNVFGDTWEYDGKTWSLAASTAPRKRLANGH